MSHSNRARASGKERVIIFDTTLRDGEQSPGASARACVNTQSKLFVNARIPRR
jgi:hypothetical protein